MGGQFLEANRPALTILIADLDRTGIEQAFVDEGFGYFRRRALWFKIDRLNDCIGALALVRLSEPDHGAAEGRERS